jgi:hydroxypyruvate isomerase
MPRFAANLTMLFIEYPVLERFERARAAGFEAVEFLFPYEEDIAGIEDAVRCNGLEYVLFDLPIGDMEAGERGITNAPRRVAEFRADVQRALELARRFDVKLLNCLVGSTLPDVPEEQQWETVVENLRYAAEQAQQYGVAILVEPLNTFDNPGFLLATTRQGLDLLERVGHPNLKLQYDVYHAQRMEGNLTATLRAQLASIAHIQIADSPARNEPGTGEINYPFVFDTLDELGYDGWVSLEYLPSTDTEASLSWLRAYGYWS